MKRAFDIVAAACGLVLLLPVFVMVALLVRCKDGGPAFYRQTRIGRHGRSFRIWKFRTMVDGADRIGPPLTAGRDPRITPIGHWLRKFKFDEIPQLLNVLTGEMSLVGPRPEVPQYVDLYNSNQRRVLDIRPGITDPASLKYFNEHELLANSDDPERDYVEQIMPEKIHINLEYAAGATLRTDVLVIVRTLVRIVVRRRGPKRVSPHTLIGERHAA